MEILTEKQKKFKEQELNKIHKWTLKNIDEKAVKNQNSVRFTFGRNFYHVYPKPYQEAYILYCGKGCILDYICEPTKSLKSIKKLMTTIRDIYLEKV